MISKIEVIIQDWKSENLIKDKNIIEAFRKIRREDFVPEDLKEEAYADMPLEIGYGQTISQPTTVAIMTQALDLKKGMKVLEVGTGSGYQAAIIGEIIGKAGRVYTVERIHNLVDYARQNIKKTGLKNIYVIESDGSLGYAKEAPYDRIIVTAASPEIPHELLKQLKRKGILVVPVGTNYQRMLRIEKPGSPGKKYNEKNLGDFIFVPLRGKHGFR
jgi:protein-L-isoaspartate(D-aspartate) O-methyltransferase